MWLVALGVTACGGSSGARGTTRLTASIHPIGAGPFGQPTVAQENCVRQHLGMPSFTGPISTLAASRSFGNPKYVAMLNGCGIHFVHGAGLGAPLSVNEVRLLHGYIVCVARNGYKLPTPNTSGNAPVFPAGTDRVRRYKVAARGCVSLADLRVAAP